MTEVDRYAGQSKMNFVGLALHGFKALMVFAEDVLVRVGIVCALITGLSVVATAAAVVLKAIGVFNARLVFRCLGYSSATLPTNGRACAHDFNADGSCARAARLQRPLPITTLSNK